MKKTIFTIFFLVCWLNLTFAQTQLKNFDEIFSAFKKGKTVKAVFYYAKCQLISDNEIKEKVPDAIGGMTISTYEYFAEGAVRNKTAFIVTSETKLIQNPLNDGHVYNYVKVKISADNKVKITAQYLNPITFEIEMDENFFTDINDGKNDAGAYFFVD